MSVESEKVHFTSLTLMVKIFFKTPYKLPTESPMLFYSQNVFKLARTHSFVLLTYDFVEINCLIDVNCD